MVRPLSARDFRAVRHILESRDYALPGRRRPPSDRIDKRTWHSIWDLPDSVTISTTDDFGSVLQAVKELASGWTGLYGPLGMLSGAATDSPLTHMVLEANDAFEASILNAVVGYYRVAFTALRSVVENTTIALHLALAQDSATFHGWLDGRELKFGWAADLVRRHAPVVTLEAALTRRTGNDLFRQSQPTRRAGHARLLFDMLSKHAHARPGYTDGDFWESNGPIFAPRAFARWANTFAATYALSLLLVRLGSPTLHALDHERHRSIRELYQSAVGHLAPRASLRRVLRAVPASTWA